jgi:hypothetical protein
MIGELQVLLLVPPLRPSQIQVQLPPLEVTLPGVPSLHIVAGLEGAYWEAPGPGLAQTPSTLLWQALVSQGL